MRYKNIYLFRQDKEHWILLEGKAQKYIANEIGKSQVYISNVINGKQMCSKTTAYAITKCISRDKSLEDLFVRKEK